MNGGRFETVRPQIAVFRRFLQKARPWFTLHSVFVLCRNAAQWHPTKVPGKNSSLYLQSIAAKSRIPFKIHCLK